MQTKQIILAMSRCACATYTAWVYRRSAHRY